MNRFWNEPPVYHRALTAMKRVRLRMKANQPNPFHVRQFIGRQMNVLVSRRPPLMKVLKQQQQPHPIHCYDNQHKRIVLHEIYYHICLISHPYTDTSIFRDGFNGRWKLNATLSSHQIHITEHVQTSTHTQPNTNTMQKPPVYVN